MKKLKLLRFIFFITIFSCTFPMDLIEPKINGIKNENIFNYIKDITIDNNGNTYILDLEEYTKESSHSYTVIEKLDVNNNLLALISSKYVAISNNDNYKCDIKDGDIKEAKSCNISNIQYVEKEKKLFFVDSSYNYLENKKYILIRTLENNLVSTVFTFKNNDFYYNPYIKIDKLGNVYILEILPDEKSQFNSHEYIKLKKLDSNFNEIKDIEITNNNKSFESITNFIEDKESNFYIFGFRNNHHPSKVNDPDSNKNIIKKAFLLKTNKNKNIEKSEGINVEDILVTEKNELYINKKDNPFYNTLLKISSEEFEKNLEKNLNESNNSKLIALIPKDSKIHLIDENKKIIYASNKSNIYKIKIGENK